MKKILLFVVLLSVCSAAFAQKKAHWGVEVGYDHSWLANTAYTDDGKQSETHKSDMNGFHVGPTFVYDFLTGYKHIPSISVGLIYQYMTSEYPMGSNKKDYKELVKATTELLKQAGGKNINVSDAIYSHSIQIPVNARYTFRPNDNFGFFAYTGPMFNIYASRYQKLKATCLLDGKKNGTEEYANLLKNQHTETVWKNGEKTVNDVTDPDGDRSSKILTLYWDLGIGVNFCKYFSASISYDTCVSNQSWVNKNGDMNFDLRDNFLKLSLGFSF